MLINYVPGEECRIAIVEDGMLEEFYQERASAQIHVSNIYKGRVTNVEPSIQAAFVDFGLERNGFLHISDVHPMYFPGKDREEFEKVGSKTPRRERPPIQKCFRRGQEVLVQVLKEGIGTKGPTVTSYLSIPGRFLVMMPYMQRLGVSRKVEDDEVRREMRDILKELDPPKEFGFIVRTAGIGQTKTDLKRDLAYLTRLWKSIERTKKKTRRVGELYAESDLVIRTIRDVFTTDISRVVVDDLGAARRAHDFLAVANPRSKSKVVYYEDPVPLFHRFDIERQIETISAREVSLGSGGALVIDQTEALVAIDVNSGKSRDAKDAETNAFRTNEEAVDEICRQLRLRDLGGLIVLDLIDMMAAKHRRAIETRMRNNLKRDRARTRTGSISQFGMLEMTRQRMRPSLKKSIYSECRHCDGRGHTMSIESVVLRVMRRLALAMQHKEIARIELTISPDVAFHLLNRKRAELSHLEQRHNIPVLVRVGGTSIDYLHIEAHNERGGLLDVTFEGKDTTLPASTKTTFRELDDQSLTDALEALEAEAPSVVQQSPGDAEEPSDGDIEADVEVGADDSDEDGVKKKRRRRRRGGRGRRKKGGDEKTEQGVDQSTELTEEASGTLADSMTSEESSAESQSSEALREASPDDAPKKKRRRRRGGRRRKSAGDGGPETQDDESGADDLTADGSREDQERDRSDDAPAKAGSEGVDTTRKKKSRSRKQTTKKKDKASDVSAESATAPAEAATSGGYGNSLIAADVEPPSPGNEEVSG